MLANESFLHVLHCADYTSLVLAKFAGPSLLRFITKYAAELACRRRFVVLIYGGHLVYYEMTNTVPHSKMISYEPGSQQSLAAACREVADVIGPHIIFQLVFDGRQWNMPGVDAIFEAAPPLKYAEYVQLICLLNSTISDSCDAFMSNFAAMKELRVWFDYEVFRQFDWTFVGRESARELRLVKFTRAPFWQGNANGLVEGLVHYCITRLPRLRGREPLELDFSGISFPAAFGLCVIKSRSGASTT